jgi:hypothetical protein
MMDQWLETSRNAWYLYGPVQCDECVAHICWKSSSRPVPANRVAQIHAPSQLQKSQKKIPLVGTTCPNLPLPPRNPLIRLNTAGQ